MNKKVLLITMCILCSVFIFFNSSQTSAVSNIRSRDIVDSIINIFSKTSIGKAMISKISYTEFNLLIRKCAHAFEFFILSVVASNMIKLFKNKISDIIVYTSFIVLFLAVVDEYFQLFVNNRTSSVVDVLIDFCGGLVGLFLFFLFRKKNK